MKKSITLKILSLSILSISCFASAQVGIGTTTPRGALDINNPTIFNMALVLPTNPDVNNMINPQGGSVVEGSIMYDSTLDCIRLYQQNNGNGTPGWSTCIGAGGPPTTSVASINCSTPTHIGAITHNSPTFASFTINYTGGDGSSYPEEIVNSTGVNGLVARRVEGEFNNGDGHITYSITGTPTSKGIAVFPITIGGFSCNVSRNVEPAIPAIDFSTNCTGFMLPYRTNNSSVSGRISGLPVTATFSQFTNIDTIPYNILNCGISTSPANSFSIGLNNVNSSMTIRFSRPVTNLKVYQVRFDINESYNYTLRRNGIDVTRNPRVIIGSTASTCYNSFEIRQNQITSINSIPNSGTLYIVGGAWFDEIVISTNANVGNGSIFNFCIGNTY
ncbi:hypothetical protein [Chishuiella changwenlii]|uniref:hypothetical protein n=1 Tax=Chishuiella changwenlii TaxID=1434701 RepID=UPI002FD8DA95